MCNEFLDTEINQNLALKTSLVNSTIFLIDLFGKFHMRLYILASF